MLELYVDQTGTAEDRFSILGGVMIETEDLFAVTSAFMRFKLKQGLHASSPIKTAGWQENGDYVAMQRHGNVPRLLTDCCSFIADQTHLSLLAGIVDLSSAEYSTEETDERLIDMASSRLQMEAQSRRRIYLNGTPTAWKQPPVPTQPHKLGVEARLIADYPGQEEETQWDRMTRLMWKMCGRSNTKLVLLDDCIYYAHTRSCAMLQLADVMIGATRSYLRGGPRDRFGMLLPRFRTHRNHVRGAGLVFDPNKDKGARLAEQFSADYPDCA